jgi:outer membrane protein TolC
MTFWYHQLRLLIAGLIFFASSSLALEKASAEVVSVRLGLKEAVRFALENSPVFDTSQKNFAIKELEFKNSISKLLPSADLSAIHGLQNNIPIAGNNTLLTPNPAAPWYSSISLGATEVLYDNGVSWTQSRIAQLNRDLARIQNLKSRDTIALNVMLEFYRFSLATIMLEVREQQIALLEKQYRSVSSQYQQGFKTRNDFVRLKTQLQRAEIDRNQAQNRLSVSRAELQKLLGIDYRAQTLPDFEPLRVKNKAERDFTIPSDAPRFQEFYDFQLAQLQEEVNEKNVSFAKRNYWPRISVTSGITYSNLNYLNSDSPFTTTNQLSWYALLGIQYNLWDWGIRRREVEIAKHQRDIQDNMIHQGWAETRSQIESLMADLARLRRSYQLTEELLRLEEQTNENLSLQYREGKVSFLDLISSLNNLLDAKSQFYASYFEVLQGMARYRYFQGKVYEDLSQE